MRWFIPQTSDDILHIDPELLARWNHSVPRYTSYPTAPMFYSVDDEFYQKRLSSFDRTDKPLSVYIHIPFCKTMCLFCGCSVVLNRKKETQRAYLDCLLKEISMLAFSKKRLVSQLHLGGGTPTSLTEEEFDLLFAALHEKFVFLEDGEISIEIDPRTVFGDGGKKLKKLRQLGFNRVSFGVQDLDPQVQEAVKRRQTEEMTVSTYFLARELGFSAINLDLIYGLPYQTPKQFAKTALKIAQLKPDRIAFFSYAKVPWLKLHQKAIDEALLPSDIEKFTIYTETRACFMDAGYVPIGMDHFAFHSDSLSQAYLNKKMVRNFQGYAVSLADDMIGLGMSSIGFIENTYIQNKKTMAEYGDAIAQGVMPVHVGYALHEHDLLRRYVIQKMMCDFSVDKREFLQIFAIPFDLYFAKERSEMDFLKKEGLAEESQEFFSATSVGRLFIRLVASVFDAYRTSGMYSKVV
jgi:oxygen-independent coproporphyrinogen-3 oxidase